MSFAYLQQNKYFSRFEGEKNTDKNCVLFFLLIVLVPLRRRAVRSRFFFSFPWRAHTARYRPLKVIRSVYTRTHLKNSTFLTQPHDVLNRKIRALFFDPKCRPPKQNALSFTRKAVFFFSKIIRVNVSSWNQKKKKNVWFRFRFRLPVLILVSNTGDGCFSTVFSV